MPGKSWTVEQIALVKKLWAAGETAAAIGVRLGGLSRSAVLGQVFRLRLRADKAATARPAPAKSAADGGAETAPARRRRGASASSHHHPLRSKTGSTKPFSS